MSPDDPEYVGFWPRLFAWLVDKLFFFLIVGAMVLVFSLPTGSLLQLVQAGLACHGEDCSQLLQANAGLLWAVVLRWLVPALMVTAFLSRMRATPGKRLVRMEVVDARTGQTITPRQAFLRALACLLSLWAAGLGYLWVLRDPRKQAWHDKIAGTVVVRPGRTR